RGELILVSFECSVRGVLQLLRFPEVAIDLALTLVEQAADARQRNPGDDQIERDERDQQRHQLRGKGVLLERRKRVSAIGSGMGARGLVAMTFSHGLLLYG